MVSVIGVVWLIAPEVPVTITATVLLAVFLELEPQPIVNSTPTSSAPSTPIRIVRFRNFDIGSRSLLRAAKATPNSPKPENGSQPINIPRPYPPGGATEAAIMVRLEVETLDPGVIVAGEKLQVTPDGGFVQLNEITPLNPPVALALIDTVVDCPGATVALCAEKANAKSAPVAADAGSNVANKPLVCVLPPAVK
jgi:hypothetical protein